MRNLSRFQDTSSRAADMLKTSCQPDDAVTPSARLAAVSKRLETMLQAVKLVRSALVDFYATLSESRTPSSRRSVCGEQPQVNPTPASMAAAETFSQIDFSRMGGSRTTDEVLSHQQLPYVLYGSISSF